MQWGRPVPHKETNLRGKIKEEPVNVRHTRDERWKEILKWDNRVAFVLTSVITTADQCFGLVECF